MVYIAAACPAQAAEKIAFDVPSGALDAALVRFAQQAGVSIQVNDPALRSARTSGLHGRYTVRTGLRRLLRGTGYDFTISAGGVVRIIPPRRLRPVPTRPRPSREQRPIATLSPQPQPPAQPIIVTATKQNSALEEYPGSVHVASFEETQSFRFGGRGSQVLLRELPNLASTDLGSGRNKIFIRGIADSSFNGQTQATVSQYLGESRLIYSAPDPDLALYDVERVEVIEGPQGTLYGAGSLGGVIRVVTRPPELGLAELAGTGALSLTDGEVGTDAAIVANLPIGENVAVRATAYHIRRPGYIDDLERGLSDINRTKISGVRAALRWKPRERWTLDIGLVGQNTASKDGQYTDSATAALTRRSFVAQPFENDYRLAFITAQAVLGPLELVSNTSYTDHSIDTVFDATSPTDQIPTAFEEDVRVSLLTHETRISGASGALSSWVAGFAVARNVNHVGRSLGPSNDPSALSMVRSETFDSAAFAEGTLPIWHSFALTAGGRLSFVRQVDEFAGPLEVRDLEPVRTNLRFLPTLALSWKPWHDIIGYLRYQEGFRPGAQQLTGAGAQISINRFEPDEIRTTEIGVRFGSAAKSRLSGGLSFAYSRWNDVQADLVTDQGFPFVSNLGSGCVRYGSADLVWRPNQEFSLEASGFLTTSHLDKPAPAFATAAEKDLPNIADSGWRLTARYKPYIASNQVSLDASVGYVGKSHLAIGGPLERSQGGYLDTAIGARTEFGNWGVSLDVDNVLDSRANRFSYGNPFSLGEGNQRTPLRPRTIRLVVDARF